MAKPLCIDLYCGLGGWAEGFLSEGFDCIGFDIERHDYGAGGYPGQLVLRDILTLHGSQFRDAACIVASPPCQRYSYMAQPWKRAKREASWQRWQRSSQFSPGFNLNNLFGTCFRIQREANEAAGHHIPMVVENVKGAQPWVGRAKAHYGSFYLWGDVEDVGGRIVASGAVRFGMPSVKAATRNMKFNPDGTAHPSGSWFAIADSANHGARDGLKVDGFNFHQHEKGLPGGSFQSAAVAATKNGTGGSWFAVSHGKDNGQTYGKNPVRGVAVGEGVKIGGSGDDWWREPLQAKRREATAIKNGKDSFGWSKETPLRNCNSKSNSRKAASAMIAKIPFELSAHIARCFKSD